MNRKVIVLQKVESLTGCDRVSWCPEPSQYLKNALVKSLKLLFGWREGENAVSDSNPIVSLSIFKEIIRNYCDSLPLYYTTAVYNYK